MRKRVSYLLLTGVAFASLLFAGSASARSYPFRAVEVAPATACPGQSVGGLSAEEQVGAMLCMTNYARAVNGLGALSPSRQLKYAAEGKSADILDCDQFSHEACGRPFTFWDQRYGYLKGCWKAGENIAWGTGTDATVGAIFSSWLHSPGHHANILGPYTEIGISLGVGSLEGREGAAVWTQDFGSHAC
jgi:uncharacterized protein YkwD